MHISKIFALNRLVDCFMYATLAFFVCYLIQTEDLWFWKQQLYELHTGLNLNEESLFNFEAKIEPK